jgi:hypothetical protein
LAGRQKSEDARLNEFIRPPELLGQGQGRKTLPFLKTTSCFKLQTSGKKNEIYRN